MMLHTRKAVHAPVGEFPAFICLVAVVPFVQISAARAHAQTERTKAEGEERRKTIDHQQEQERRTAQYKTRLDAESYQKKLQDQQRQNEEFLRQQHQQFLRQEEQRKKTEAEVLEMRRQQLREEKALEQKLQAERIREEAKGRILQERENIDVHLRAMRAKAAEERKTKLESLQATFSSVGAAFSHLMTDKAQLTTLVGSVTALAAGIYGARAAASIGGRYVEARMGKPPLVRETSRWTFARSFFSPLRFLRGSRGPGSASAALEERLVLEPELAERLQWTTNSLLTTKAHKVPFRHLLLHGPPGTGKTLFARTLARSSGMDYAIMTGGDVGPLGRDGASEINKLFAWAEKSRKGLILFIDEADAFLRQGRAAVVGAGSEGMSEDSRNAISAFLHHTGTETDKFCVVLATNCREILDRAVLDRVDEQFEFPLPGAAERLRMLQQFMDRYLRGIGAEGKDKQKLKGIVIDERIDEAFMQMVAEKTEGFSGRQLAKLVLAMQAAVFGSGTNTLTRGVAAAVLDWKVKHLAEDVEMFDRQRREVELKRMHIKE
ncbi:AAA family protein [Cyclospora cayetanensis]|uniref:AAA family protein n=1 Tax=Cyclospora cayetanensis TaxID=88456 RepID=A0A1D3D528_9EIME|nr:AAA family protein [Cyclospora cayetanensis]